MTDLILLGGPSGSGKSTLATKLAESIDGAVVFSGGAYLRQMSRETTTARAVAARDILAADAAVPLSMFEEMCVRHLVDAMPEVVVSDAMPRSRAQYNVLRGYCRDAALAVILELPPTVAASRANRARFECAQCGRVTTTPLPSCGYCGGAYVLRPVSVGPRRRPFTERDPAKEFLDSQLRTIRLQSVLPTEELVHSILREFRGPR